MNEEKLQKLFEAADKKTAVRLVHELTVDANEFFKVITAANVVGYKHALERREFQPDYAKDVPSFIDAIVAGSKSDDPAVKKAAKKANNMIDQLFVERKQRVFHFFIKDENHWHLFYFTEQDYVGEHYDGGTPHFHYTSHLWGHKLAEIVKQVESRNIKFATEHVKIIPLKVRE